MITKLITVQMFDALQPLLHLLLLFIQDLQQADGAEVQAPEDARPYGPSHQLRGGHRAHLLLPRLY